MADFEVTFSEAVPVCNNDYNALRNKPSINGETLMGDVVIPVGVSAYEDLTGKPSINGVEVTGNTTIPVGVSAYEDLTGKPSINGVEVTGDINIPVGVSNYNNLENKPKINGFTLVGNMTHINFDKVIDIDTSSYILTESVLSGKTLEFSAGDTVLIRFNYHNTLYNVGIGTALSDTFICFSAYTGYSSDYMYFGRYDNGTWRLYKVVGERQNT